SDIGVQLALKNLPRKHDVASVNSESDAVGYKGLANLRGEPGRKIADLISVAEDHQPRRELFDRLFRSANVAVGSVLSELIVFYGVDGFELLCGDLTRDVRHRLAENDSGYLIAGLRSDPLRRDYGFKRRAVQHAVALLD